MPVYTYRCANCGVQFDKQQPFSDQPLTRCPECGKKTLKKVYQPVGIVFKGSGFYATDHHSPSGQSPKKDDRDDRKGGGESKESVAKTEKGSEKNEEGGSKEAATKTEKNSKVGGNLNNDDRA